MTEAENPKGTVIRVTPESRQMWKDFCAWRQQENARLQQLLQGSDQTFTPRMPAQKAFVRPEDL